MLRRLGLPVLQSVSFVMKGGVVHRSAPAR